jgi:alpha-galactosidase
MRRHLSISVVVVLTIASQAAFAVTTDALGDASISHDVQAGTWTLAAGGAALTVAADASRDWQTTALVSPTGRDWLVRAAADTRITANGSVYDFGSRAAGFFYRTALVSNDGRRLQLDATFALPGASLVATRHIAIVPGSPVFEIWTTLSSSQGPMAVSDLNLARWLIPPGTLHWVTGHTSDPNDPTLDSNFAQRQQTLSVGDSLTLGGRNRSSEQVIPWLAVDGQGDEWFAGLMWSGAWTLTVQRTSSGDQVDWGLGPMTTSVGATPVEGPHVLVGVARGSTAEASQTIKTFIVNGIRNGQPLVPLVTYNTWYSYGTSIDDTSLRGEMDRAAALGAEIFVVDAGWYSGADTDNTSNFDQGLGTWEVDPSRFPDGMGALRDYAHGLGMKFGIWVEPERVNRSVIGEDGLEESSLATAGGDYQASDSAQVCLVGAAGRQWVFDHLTALLDQVQPDYLKWDNNLWVNCDRAGHGHGPSDGNFAQVTALYRMLAQLRTRYPNLLIENCSSGGNRLDFGMLRYTDTAWMDDRTAPSVHVRHNIEGLSAMFPPAYLLSFVTNHVGESIVSAEDLSLYFRSRMTGILGLCFLTSQLSDQDTASIAAEIAIYKTTRSTLSDGSATLLSEQASASNPPPWDVLQETSTDGTALLYAFENTGVRNTTTTVTPKGLIPDMTYEVRSADSGLLGQATGADLMASGVELVQSATSASHLLMIVPMP